jgi:hypothetical protein
MIEEAQKRLLIYQHAVQLTIFSRHTPKSALKWAREMARLAFDDEAIADEVTETEVEAWLAPPEAESDG